MLYMFCWLVLKAKISSFNLFWRQLMILFSSYVHSYLLVVVLNICMHASNCLTYPSVVWVHINMFHTIITSSFHACLSCSFGASNSAGACERCDGCTNYTRLTQDLLQQHKTRLPVVLLHSPQEPATPTLTSHCLRPTD
jgi:hypothetical protein